MTTVERCTCKHEFQDKEYGKGKRVHNLGVSKSNSKPDRVCTVCGNRKSG